MDVDPMIGMSVAGRYVLTGVLGEGGMGVVYEADQPDLGRSVAIKIMRGQYASDPRVVERFLREARAVGSLEHPNIVDIHDVGRLEDGRPFMVMPRLEGHDLAYFLEEGLTPLPVERVIELLAGPASALDLIHGQGIVHRDLKPENLFLVRLANGEEVVKLVDFGLAALLDQPGSRLTRAGLVTGTPQYMSPEATNGALPDGRGDVYALAAIAFELLTGRLPFDGPDPVEILLRKRQEPAPRVSSFGVEVSPELEAVIARGLDRNRAARPSTAGAFVASLRRAMATPLVNRRVTEQVEPSSGSEPPPSIPLHGAPPVARWVGVVAVLVAFGGGIGWWSRAPEPDASTTISSGPRVPRSELDLAGAATPAASIPSTATPSTDDAMRDAGAHRESVSDPTTPPPPVTRRRSRVRETAVPTGERETTRSVATATVAEAVAPAPSEAGAFVPPAEDPERARLRVEEGTRALMQGRVPAAVTLFREATVAAPGEPSGWRGLGLANQRLDRRVEAARAYRRYLRIAPRAPDADAIRARLDALEPE